MVYQQLCVIIENSKQHLSQITQCNDIELIDQLNIWSLSVQTSFSFIDLIKGIVPTKLFKFINSSLTVRVDALAATSNFMHYIFEHTQVIWRDRCVQFKDFEESLEITESLKHLHINASGYNLSTSQKAFSALPLINNMIRLGTHWTNFWCSRGQVFFHF
jgi:hypothetical protein